MLIDTPTYAPRHTVPVKNHPQFECLQHIGKISYKYSQRCSIVQKLLKWIFCSCRGRFCSRTEPSPTRTEPQSPLRYALPVRHQHSRHIQVLQRQHYCRYIRKEQGSGALRPCPPQISAGLQRGNPHSPSGRPLHSLPPLRA